MEFEWMLNSGLVECAGHQVLLLQLQAARHPEYWKAAIPSIGNPYQLVGRPASFEEACKKKHTTMSDILSLCLPLPMAGGLHAACNRSGLQKTRRNGDEPKCRPLLVADPISQTPNWRSHVSHLSDKRGP